MSASTLSAASMMSLHRDVLDADPDTDESKQKLVDELQSRGRAAVGSKSWMDAKLLYEKALSISTVDSHKKAIFYSNLSLVEKNMGKTNEARDAAEKAIAEDPDYLKGHWRLGQALVSLDLPDEALAALSNAKKLDPSNKALVKELQKVQKLAEVQKKQDEKNADKKKNVNKPAITALSSNGKPVKSESTLSSSNFGKKNSSHEKDSKMRKNDLGDNDDSDLFTKSDPIRGYKIVNGKKTSYFHNELDEETKNLIGNTAPKRIHAAPCTSNATKALGTSQWNEAGTWEEKDVTPWAKETLSKSIRETKFVFPSSSPAPSAIVEVEKIQDLTGHASVAVVRGKVRFIYEFSCKLNWVLEKDDDDLSCKGSLSIPDIDGTICLGEGYDIVDFNIESVSDGSIRPVVDRFVHRGGFREALDSSIDDWVRLFKVTHGPKM